MALKWMFFNSAGIRYFRKRLYDLLILLLDIKKMLQINRFEYTSLDLLLSFKAATVILQML
jgi:hypothetical protein